MAAGAMVVGGFTRIPTGPIWRILVSNGSFTILEKGVQK